MQNNNIIMNFEKNWNIAKNVKNKSIFYIYVYYILQ